MRRAYGRQGYEHYSVYLVINSVFRRRLCLHWFTHMAALQVLY